jgi:hypothetical protein|tara:strand:+ start:636 stop:746 length:111 start_codon:yes stop_codon:yes gene_type:complete
MSIRMEGTVSGALHPIATKLWHDECKVRIGFEEVWI